MYNLVVQAHKIEGYFIIILPYNFIRAPKIRISWLKSLFYKYYIYIAYIYIKEYFIIMLPYKFIRTPKTRIS